MELTGREAAEISIQDNIRNGLLSGGGFLGGGDGNRSNQYGDRQFPYFADATEAFEQERAEYASDYFRATAIGLDPNDPFREYEVKMRMANVVRPSAAIQRSFDDFKEILIPDKRFGYIRQGTKFFVEGSWWLAYNPDNISNISAGGIIRRCNATWRFLDWYGNVHSEPICVEAVHSNANTPDAQSAVVIPKGYFNVVCQYNRYTAQINDNTRLILGSRAYSVSGFSDFETEFTEDDASVRLLRFSVRVEEPNLTIDDMERRVAGGRAFSWELSVAGDTQLYVGTGGQLSVTSVRNGQIVADTTEHPIDYRFESDDVSVVTVDRGGKLSAASEGTAVVTVTLARNPAIQRHVAVTVNAAQKAFVAFDDVPPQSVTAYGGEIALTAAYYESGRKTTQAVEWSFTGANSAAYRAEVNGNTVTLRCMAGSVTPLTVTATCNEKSVDAVIALTGL